MIQSWLLMNSLNSSRHADYHIQNMRLWCKSVLEGSQSTWSLGGSQKGCRSVKALPMA